MWKFFREDNGKILPNANSGTELICDAFVWVMRQDPDAPGMTVLARTGTAKNAFGRPRGESIERSWRFTKRDAATIAVFAAQLISPLYERYAPNDDRVSRAVAAASSEDQNVLVTVLNSVALAAGDARGAGDEAAALAAESARSAVLAALSADAGKALHAAAYGVAYSIQGASQIGMGDDITREIEKRLYTWIMEKRDAGRE